MEEENNKIKFDKIWQEINRKLAIKDFRYGNFPPKHGVNISDIKAIIRPIIKNLIN